MGSQGAIRVQIIWESIQSVEPVMQPEPLNISEPPPASSSEPKMLTTFVFLQSNSKVLLADVNQGHLPDCQNSNYLGKQWLSNAVATITKAKIQPIALWNNQTLNDILFNADDLHAEILVLMNRANRRSSHNQINDIVNLKYVENKLQLFGSIYQIKFSADTVIEGPLIEKPNELWSDDLPLKDGLAYFFKDHRFGVLSVLHQKFAIIYDNQNYYIFHPDTNWFDKKKAALFQSQDISTFYTVVERILGSDDNFYSIDSIDVIGSTNNEIDACDEIQNWSELDYSDNED